LRPDSNRRLRIIAHRGDHRTEPENSLAACAAALARGADGLEVDLRLTADGTLICFHDWYLKRLMGRSGRVGQTGIEQLLEWPLRHPTSGRKRPVATLPELLTLVEDRALLVLDLKQESVRHSRLEQETLRLLREFGLCDNIVISSFSPWVLRRVRQLAPRYTTALIAASRLGVRLFDPAYCDALHVNYRLLERRWFVRMAATFPRLVIWTVDRKSDVDLPPAGNVYGIMTNRIDRWLRRRPGPVRGPSALKGVQT
jgi:glycerophosphoryl diester phosphodiesterase